MPLLDLNALANALPKAWQSTIVGQVGNANIKVLKMDEMAYAEETHGYNEGLLVLNGRLLLDVAGETIAVEAGQMFLAEAGVAHAVKAGSYGTLVIFDA